MSQYHSVCDFQSVCRFVVSALTCIRCLQAPRIGFVLASLLGALLVYLTLPTLRLCFDEYSTREIPYTSLAFSTLREDEMSVCCVATQYEFIPCLCPSMFSIVISFLGHCSSAASDKSCRFDTRTRCDMDIWGFVVSHGPPHSLSIDTTIDVVWCWSSWKIANKRELSAVSFSVSY